MQRGKYVNKSFFQDNKKDSQKVWKRTRSIVSITNKKSIQNINLNIGNETITDDKVISNDFNKFFRSIAGKPAKKYQTQLKFLIHT